MPASSDDRPRYACRARSAGKIRSVSAAERSSARTTAACRSPAAGSSSSVYSVSRTRSWANANRPSPSDDTSRAATAWPSCRSTCATGAPTVADSTCRWNSLPSTAAAVSSRDTAWGSRESRRRTASLTPGATSVTEPPLCQSRTVCSTKNGLPPVRRCTSPTRSGSGSRPTVRVISAPTSSRSRPVSVTVVALASSGSISGAQRVAGGLHLHVAVRADQQQPLEPGVLRDELQQPHRRRVGPVQVVQHDHHRPPLRHRDQRGGHRVVQVELVRRRRAGPVRRAGPPAAPRPPVPPRPTPRRPPAAGAPRTTCTHGQYPGAAEESQQDPDSTSAPCSRATSMASVTKVVFPIPASPVTSTNPPWLPVARPISARSTPAGWSRPMSPALMRAILGRRYDKTGFSPGRRDPPAWSYGTRMGGTAGAAPEVAGGAASERRGVLDRRACRTERTVLSCTRLTGFLSVLAGSVEPGVPPADWPTCVREKRTNGTFVQSGCPRFGAGFRELRPL